MASKKKVTAWTVLVLRPDYIADEFGKDTFLYYPRCENPETAIARSQLAAAKADGAEKEDSINYHCLMCVSGKHVDYSSVAQ